MKKNNLATVEKNDGADKYFVTRANAQKMTAETYATYRNWSREYEYCGLPYFVIAHLFQTPNITPTDVAVFIELHREFMAAVSKKATLVSFNRHSLAAWCNVSARSVDNSKQRLKAAGAILFAKSARYTDSDYFVICQSLFEDAAKESKKRRRRDVGFIGEVDPAADNEAGSVLPPPPLPPSDSTQPETPTAENNESSSFDTDKANAFLEKRKKEIETKQAEIQQIESKRPALVKTLEEAKQATKEALEGHKKNSKDLATARAYTDAFTREDSLVFRLERLESAIKVRQAAIDSLVSKMKASKNKTKHEDSEPANISGATLTRAQHKARYLKAFRTVREMMRRGLLVSSNRADQVAYRLYEWGTFGWGEHKAKDYNHAINIGWGLLESGKFEYETKFNPGKRPYEVFA